MILLFICLPDTRVQIQIKHSSCPLDILTFDHGEFKEILFQFGLFLSDNDYRRVYLCMYTHVCIHTRI